MLTSIFSYSQASKDINNYKNVIVPYKFDFLKEKNQYQLNALTKFLFNKKFTAYLDNENLPKELLVNKCSALSVDFLDNSGMFNTILKLEIKNCLGAILFSSDGESKEKSYEKAYQMAIRDAYAKFEKNVNYKYQPITISDELVIKEDIPVVVKPIIKESINTKKIEGVSNISLETLYAQKKKNGFQLINTTPEILFFILKTNLEDVFIIKDKNGILYKNNRIWIAEFLENDKIISKSYQIKF